jgi:hypothetical protein
MRGTVTLAYRGFGCAAVAVVARRSTGAVVEVDIEVLGKEEARNRTNTSHYPKARANPKSRALLHKSSAPRSPRWGGREVGSFSFPNSVSASGTLARGIQVWNVELGCG